MPSAPARAGAAGASGPGLGGACGGLAVASEVVGATRACAGAGGGGPAGAGTGSAGPISPVAKPPTAAAFDGPPAEAPRARAPLSAPAAFGAAFVSAAACTAAPCATTSSGLTLPAADRWKYSSTRRATMGMRVAPPTSKTRSISVGSSPTVSIEKRQVSIVRSMSGFARASSRFLFMANCAGTNAPPSPRTTSFMSTVASSRSERECFSFSARARRSARAVGSGRGSKRNFWRKKLVISDAMAWSTSSPPRDVSPPVASTSKTSPERSSSVMSNVPPPRSYTAIRSDLPDVWPYARAAAVGSFRMRRTSRPASLPASFVAARCGSLKFAGTVMTALSTTSPSAASATAFARRSTKALISGSV